MSFVRVAVVVAVCRRRRRRRCDLNLLSKHVFEREVKNNIVFNMNVTTKNILYHLILVGDGRQPPLDIDLGARG